MENLILIVHVLVSLAVIGLVLVQHGNYITAYNNLENSLVKMGDKVTIGQELGKVYTDKVTGKTTLIFLLFKNTTRLNPASWMLKR